MSLYQINKGFRHFESRIKLKGKCHLSLIEIKNFQIYHIIGSIKYITGMNSECYVLG